VQTRRISSLPRAQLDWKALMLAVIMALYFSAISLHQTHASEISGMQTVVSSAQSPDSGNSDRDVVPRPSQCADQMHCHSAAILPREAPSHKHAEAGAIFSYQTFAWQLSSPFPTPPPKIS